MRRAGILAAWLLAGLALLPALAVAAFTLRTDVDARRIGVEDRLQLTITLEGGDAPDEIPLPPLTNLELVSGPFQSSQMSIVNGRVSQSRSHTYVLQPKAVGKAEIGALTVAGQTAPAIPIEVVAGSVGQRPSQRPDPLRMDPFRDPFEEMLGRRAGRTAAPKLLVTATASRSRLHVGEPLVLTYWIDTQTSVADMQFKDPPQFAGFWVEDLERPQAASAGEAVTIEGEAYRRFPVLRKLLFPTKAGALVVPAATFRVGLARQSFFDAGGVVERATKPLTITVEPLPEAPGFSGAVGKLRASASLDREVVPLGEAATVRFRVEGTGNLKWIDRGPDVAISGAKVFPPQVKSDLATTPEGIRGSRTWEFVVVPETSGRIEVPPLSFSYFDPAAGRIVTAATAPLALRVEGGVVAGPAAPVRTGARAVAALPLRSALELPVARVPAVSGTGLALLAAATLLLHAGLWAALGLRARLRPGSTSHASARSVRAALRELERAGSGQTSKEQSASLVEKALHEAFGDLPDEDESERARAVRALLDEARFVRYAPQLGDYSDKVRDLAARAAAVVRRWA